MAGDRRCEAGRGRVTPVATHARAASAWSSPAAPRTASDAVTAFPAAPAIRPQFGSLPCAAALTRLLDTTARAIAAGVGIVVRAADRCRDQDRRALAVGRLLSRQIARDRLERSAEGQSRRGCRQRSAPPPTRRTPARTPCRSCSCRRRPTAGPRSRAAAGRSRFHSTSGGAAGVGQDDRQHRRHVRVDHPDALGDAGHRDRDGFTVARRAGRAIVDGDLGHRVGRAQRLRDRSERCVGIGELRRERLDATLRPCRAAAASR